MIIGAGPAGLTAAYELAKAGVHPVVFEKDNIVGGISRTEEYKGYRFDIGGHRFFTKVEVIHKWWMDILEEEFLLRPRLSRIFYKDTFFDYPLKPANALFGLGVFEAARCGFSYVYSQIFPEKPEENLEQWVSNRFGKRLYSIFFKTYTEKVWGIPCTDIGADWAAQRIKNLDLKSAVKNAFLGNRGNITTLIEQFHYPKLGPGQMWERVRDLLVEQDHPVHMERNVVKLHHDGKKIVAVTTEAKDGTEAHEEGAHFISTMPIRELLNAFDPPPPPEVLEAANKLRYRDFLTVGLIMESDELFPDNWIYIHSSKVKVGRIQNFRNWSPYMVPEGSKTTAIGLEYFVQIGDELWNAKDEDLIELGEKETNILGLTEGAKVLDGVVIRMPKAYPVYDRDYKDALDIIRPYLDGFPNLQLVGRNGQHRYNNQDHSMLTAIYAAKNITGEGNYDVWDVNVEQEYHEEKEDKPKSGATGDRLVPQRLVYTPAAVLQRAFARYDAVALGGALGTVSGLGLFLATVILLIQGGQNGREIGPHLSLLGQYFFGYTVTWGGAFVGLIEAALLGFGFGFLLATAINMVVGWQFKRVVRRLERITTLQTLE